jgi:hypothetical protein
MPMTSDLCKLLGTGDSFPLLEFWAVGRGLYRSPGISKDTGTYSSYTTAIDDRTVASSCWTVVAHRGALKSIGVSDELIRRIEGDIEKADFSEKEKALIGFARG